MRLTGALATTLAGSSPPAAGAATREVVIATTGALLLTAGMLYVASAHRSGRIAWFGRAAEAAGRASGIPSWAALPGAIIAVSLLTAVVGMYWDISLHIDNGRDPGPLANPAHYLILLGLFGILFAGVAAISLPRERPSPTAVKLTDSWWAPLGGVVVFACAAFALSGFPLDDIWHRLFGQDVTLWGPTHLMLIGGASLSTLGIWLLTAEAQAACGRPDRAGDGLLMRVRQAGLAGGFLVGLSTFQGEFDFGVPQFRLVFHPLLLMLAAGIGLVAARVRLGRGGALTAVAGFLVIRGFVTLLVGPVFGQTTPHFPLYLAEAAVVELVALRVSAERPLRLGLGAGLGIGTVGLAAEWGWSHVWATIPWPAALLPQGAVLGLVGAVAGGVLGGAIGTALRPGEGALPRAARWAVPLAGLAAVAATGLSLPMSAGSRVTAHVDLTEVHDGSQRTVEARVRLRPAGGAEGANWLTATSWQGGGEVVDRLRRVGPGVYRTTRPIPVYGDWKATLRLHKGGVVAGLPLYMPDDPAIPAKGIPARRSFTRAFELDHKLLQRERKKDVPGWLTTFAYLTTLLIAAGLVAGLTVALRRFAQVRRRDAASVA